MGQWNQARAGSKRTVIWGCDGVGAIVAARLTKHGHYVHILDSRAEAFQQLPAAALEQGNIVPILGDGDIQQDLLRASIRDSDVFIALNSDDSRNALAAQVAKHVYQVPTVICRIDDLTMQQMYSELGIVATSATTLLTENVVDVANA